MFSKLAMILSTEVNASNITKENKHEVLRFFWLLIFIGELYVITQICTNGIKIRKSCSYKFEIIKNFSLKRTIIFWWNTLQWKLLDSPFVLGPGTAAPTRASRFGTGRIYGLGQVRTEEIYQHMRHWITCVIWLSN